jgi:hypothetical protein
LRPAAALALALVGVGPVDAVCNSY